MEVGFVISFDESVDHNPPVRPLQTAVALGKRILEAAVAENQPMVVTIGRGFPVR
jgi:hypothetical protein